MMGRTHALSGLLVGGVALALVPDVPPQVQLLTVMVAGGAALLPDLDHPNSTVAHSLGPITQVLARLVNLLSLLVYRYTKTDADSMSPLTSRNGHRYLTHTAPGAAILAGVVAWTTLLSPIAAAITMWVLSSLMLRGIKFRRMVFTVGVRVSVQTLNLGAAVYAWWVTSQHPQWWWLYAAAVMMGAIVHSLGDACTNSGVPIAFPFMVGGKRWKRFTTPITFSTGRSVEQVVACIFLVLVVLMAVSRLRGHTVIPGVTTLVDGLLLLLGGLAAMFGVAALARKIPGLQ